MLALLLSNRTAYAAISVSSIAPTSAAETKTSSCGVDVTGTAKDYYNNAFPWGVAGTLNTAIDVATGIGHTPAAIGHLGEGRDGAVRRRRPELAQRRWHRFRCPDGWSGYFSDRYCYTVCYWL